MPGGTAGEGDSSLGGSTEMPRGTAGGCGPPGDAVLVASASSLSELEELESEFVADDVEDDEESVSESESPL